ncbi:MAG: ABC transporter ATP-binding protein [Limnobacter sp.]|uniref:ABC transporter ATP-binding protein n=1 Tax=Limnobacter sp. TaxID=2003368 RepID=UPI0032F03338
MALLVMILIMALLEVIGVASIMPFIAVLANPQLIETNATLSAVYGGLGFTDPQNYLFFLGVLVFILLVVSLGVKAITTYAQLRFTLMREYSLGKRLIEGYLRQPYTWFLNHHSADLGKNILSEVSIVIGQGMMPLMTLIAQGTVVLALISLLVIVDPWLALSVGLVLGLSYGVIFKVMSGFLRRIGSERVKANKDRFTAVSEAFGAAKEVKVGGLEQAYIRRFAEPAETYARNHASAQAVAQLPRYVIEAIAFGGMLLVLLYLMAQSEDLSNALPIISLYVFAGYRLLPALQQIYWSLSQLKFSSSALEAMHEDLLSLAPGEDEDRAIEPLKFNHEIQLDGINFYYPNADLPALNEINMSIRAHSTIGLVGYTGSGKTTTVDIILGLLEPQQGRMIIDGNPINHSNRRQWQKVIGYVPQHIYLTDDSVAANIAFGVSHPEEINNSAVERAAKIVNLHNFVTNDLPEGYATKIGERGVRLSGGQRQRIGIARALYKSPQLLILDEATSALDNLTEQAVMDAVNNLGHELTIVMIAHRLSTVRQCDQIYLLDKGRIKAHGTYEELVQNNSLFRAMTLLK